MAKQAMQPPVKPEARNVRKAAKHMRGPDKQSVDRKRKADAVLDDLASRLSQGMLQFTSWTCLFMALHELLLLFTFIQQLNLLLGIFHTRLGVSGP